MEIVAKKRPIDRFKARHAKRGAALIYALVVVFILSLITLAMGRLVTSHFQEEENAAVYSRLIYSAEAAANWQLLQVSRTVPNLPNGTPPGNPGTGFITISQLNQGQPPVGVYNTDQINGDLNGIRISDKVQTWMASANGLPWKPPALCNIYAIATDPRATDPRTGMRRGVSFQAKGTQIGDRFSLFGRASLTFSASGNQVCAIARGYVGSNGDISYNGNTPQSVTGSPTGGMRGCLLTGPQANLVNPDSWPTDWDYPHLPDPTLYPTIDQIVSYIFPGTDISQLRTSPLTRNNEPMPTNSFPAGGDPRDYTPAIGAMISMHYRASNNTLSPSQFMDLGHVTSLGDPEFNKAVIADVRQYPAPINPNTGKPLRIIRLHSFLTNGFTGNQDANVFYFTNIQMGDNDVLLLDVRRPDFQLGTNTTACRIIIHNPNLSRAPKITNVAIVQVTDPGPLWQNKEEVGDASFIFYNDTNQPLTFQPTMPATYFYDSKLDNYVDPVVPGNSTRYPGNDPKKPTDYPQLMFALTPGCPGLAYGIRAGNSSLPAGVNDNGGAIVIDGSAVPCTVVAAIANQVKLIGNINVTQVSTHYGGNTLTRTNTIETDGDPFRYVYFYRINSGYQEINPDTLSGVGATSAFGYGSAP